MYRLTSKIQIGEWKLKGVISLQIESSWKMFTDTCTITIPKILREWKDKPVYFTDGEPLFKKSDEVIIDLGYNDINVRTFKGYVTSINSNVPITLECQDEMWLLKKNSQNLSFKDVDLKTLLSHIIPKEIPFEAADIRLGAFRVSNSTPVQILEFLKKEYFLKSWFRGGKLYVNVLPINYELQKEHTIKFNRNVISDNLIYQKSEETQIKLKVISILPNNQKIELEFGDTEGEERTLHLYDVKESDMKQIAERELPLMRYTGYRGDFLTFLEPHIQHGDVIYLIDDKYPEKNGKYQVRKVNTTFGTGGGRQNVELGVKVG